MKTYLVSQGVAKERLAVLGQFDYDTRAQMPYRELSHTVCVAGNLRRDKAGWLYALPRTKLTWNLWGAGWKGKKSRKDMIHHGIMDPDKLPGRLEGSFGVVWDGHTPECCQGSYGAYTLLNAPHRLSLYLAAGMPVVVWEGAAMADYVRESGVGLVVKSLLELPRVIAALTPEDYARMLDNARREGMELRRGQRLLAALAQIEKA